MWGVRIASALLATLASLPVLAEDKAPLEKERVAVYREQPESYAGLGLFASSIESSGISQNPGGLHVRMGGMLDPNWGAEVRLGRGVWHESDRTATTRIQLDVDYLAGAYLTSRWPFPVPFVELPLVQRMFFQAHVGAAAVQIKSRTEVCTPVCVRSESRNRQSDISWGAGLGLEVKIPRMPNRVGLSLEYMDYGEIYDDDIGVSAVEAGFHILF